MLELSLKRWKWDVQLSNHIQESHVALHTKKPAHLLEHISQSHTKKLSTHAVAINLESVITSKPSDCQSIQHNASWHRSRRWTWWNGIWCSKKLVSNAASLSQATQECSMYRGRIVADRVLTGKEHARKTGSRCGLGTARCGLGTSCRSCWLLRKWYGCRHHFIVTSYHNKKQSCNLIN